MAKITLGIIGGGQLGSMLATAAKKLKIKTIIFSDDANAPGKLFSDEFIFGDYNDLSKIKEFTDKVDLITFEFENIPYESLKKLNDLKKVIPKPEINKIIQNRLTEKNFINSLNIKTTEYKFIENLDDIKKNSNLIPGILKTCTLGYDGKGQYKILNGQISELESLNLKSFILEEILDFEKEISVIVCRKNKKIETYPAVENIHKNSILRETIFPANISEEVKKNANKIATQIANHINLNGILAIEMFLMKDKSILINELAPRPHNSGHWSIDYCEISQFHNLLNTIFFESPKSPNPISSCKMVNVIGDDFLEKDAFKKKFKFYDYFKKKIKSERKMGHYTFKI